MSRPVDPEKMPVVKLFQAFRWTCPGCQKENFDRAYNVEVEDARDVLESMGMDPDESEGLCCIPDTVTCSGCLHMFLTTERDGSETA